MTTIANKTQSYDKAWFLTRGPERSSAVALRPIRSADGGESRITLAYSADRGTSYTYRWDHHNRLTGVYDSTNTTRKAAFTWDALGRRVEFINDKLGTTTRYYYDGVNEIVEDDQSAARQRYYVHGVSYIDERLMMYRDANSRPYYYVVDRMYNVRMLIDRAGAIVERIAYDGYGQPYIRESCGRGDLDNNTQMTSTDSTRFTDAKNGTIWDPRADLDDDGDVDSADQTLFDAKRPTWDPADIDFPSPTVAQAFSDVDNPYLFQGVPHFALDTAAADTAGKLMLNHNRARLADPLTRWVNRDPLSYNRGLKRLARGDYGYSTIRGEKSGLSTNTAALFLFTGSNPVNHLDPSGERTWVCCCMGERWMVLMAVGYWCATAGYQNAQTSLQQTAQDWPNSSCHNDQCDAERHCLWSCLNTINPVCGSQGSTLITSAHEACTDNNPAGEEAMDEHNNSVGRDFGSRAGASPESCRADCKNAAVGAGPNNPGGTGTLQTTPGGSPPPSPWPHCR